jgi:hypothetical protein
VAKINWWSVYLFRKEYAKIRSNHASSILIATGNLFPKLYFILLSIVIQEKIFEVSC